MLSAGLIWEKAQEYIKREMTEASYRNLVAGLIPSRIENDDELVLVMTPDSPLNTELRFSSLSNVYKSKIESALYFACGTPLKVRFVTEEESSAVTGAAAKAGHVEPCPTLLPKYTFDNFVMGNSNRFAWASAVAVANNPATAYNPLYIYGTVGLGKTHLIHAIGNAIHASHPDYKILYVASETFTNDVISSIQANMREQLRDKYRTLDVLIVDDIQFIAGKVSTEEEFFNVFNTLRDANKQIIITSDMPPQAIGALSDRLKTRFGSGLITDIQVPDFETRVAILRNRIIQDHLEVGDDVVQLIAEHVTGNVRSLEGCLNGVVAYAGIAVKPITVELAENILKNFVTGDGSGRPVTPERIRQVVCDYYNISVDDIMAERRDKRVAVPRQVAMYLMRKLLGIPNQQIGDYFGGKHYSTVIHACELVEKKIASDPAFKTAIDDLTATINNKN